MSTINCSDTCNLIKNFRKRLYLATRVHKYGHNSTCKYFPLNLHHCTQHRQNYLSILILYLNIHKDF
jgi:hypothetical protein